MADDPAVYEDMFAPWGRVSIKRMFGGLGIYRDGRMFALVAYGTLYFKTDDETREAFRAAGGRPFRYEGKGKPIEMSYWTAPESIFEDDDTLRAWAGRAMEAAMRVKPPAKRARPATGA